MTSLDWLYRPTHCQPTHVNNCPTSPKYSVQKLRVHPVFDHTETQSQAMLAEIVFEWLPTALMGLLAIYLWIKFKAFSEYCRLVNRIPGRPGRFLMGNTLDLMVPHEDIFGTLCNLASVGPDGVSRIWMGKTPWIALSRAKHVETILSSTVHLNKGELYEMLHDWLGTGLLTSTGQKWHRRRKLITPSFHFAILNDFMQVIDEQTRLLVQELTKHSQDGQVVDLADFINLATLDIICLTAMGKSVDALHNRDSAYLKALAVFGEIYLERCYKPWLRVDWLFKLLPIGRKNAENLKVLHAFTRQVIAEKKKLFEASQKSTGSDVTEETGAFGQKRRRAFLDVLLEGAADNRLTDADIQEEVDTFMFEGHDTTTSGITMATYVIGCHPEVQRRIQEEIDSVLGDDEERPITNEDLAAMKYLDVCIKEAFRIYPPVPMFGRNLLQPQVLEGGLTLPTNTVIAMIPYLLHRDPEVFPDPERFDPTRFEPENCVGRNPYAYVPFSAGPRNCVGQRFAQMETKTVLCQLFRHFDVTPVQQDRSRIKFYAEFVLRPTDGMPVRLERRRK